MPPPEPPHPARAAVATITAAGARPRAHSTVRDRDRTLHRGTRCVLVRLFTNNSSSVGLVDDQRGEGWAIPGGDLEREPPLTDHHERWRSPRVDARLNLGQLVFLLWHLHL